MGEVADFLVEKFAEFDPSINTAAGSRAREFVINPADTRFGSDLFEVDIRTFIQDRIRQSFPSFDINETGVDDLLVKPQSIILAPLRREIQAISIQQSIENPGLLLDSEVDALLANLFVARVEGGRSRGIARLFFNAPNSFVATPDMDLSTSGGVIFHPTQLQSINAITMQANVEGSFFFFDITVEADVEGEDANIEPDQLTRLDNVPNVVRVTNKARFTGGGDRQTNAELTLFAEQNITERSLTTIRGVNSQLLANFAVEDVEVVGFGDPEMDRDIAEVVGTVLSSGTSASLSSGTLTDGGATFDTDGVRIGDTVTIFTGADLGSSFPVTAVTPTTLDLSGSPVDVGSSLSYTVSHTSGNTFTMSTIPGGVLGAVPLIIPNNQVHIGNHTDVYVKAPQFDQGSVDVLNLPDPADDKDLSDATLIDIDLLVYTKVASVGSVTTTGGDSDKITSINENLRKFGVVINDIVRFTSPDILVALGDFTIKAIDDSLPQKLTLVDPAGAPFLPSGSLTGVEFQIISTNNGIAIDQQPMIRVTSVQLMNSAATPQPISGVTVPKKDVIDVRSTDFFTSGAATSVGKFRLFFLEPTTYQVDGGDGSTRLGTVFTMESSGTTLFYRPDPDIGISGLSTGVRKVRDSDLSGAAASASGTDGKFTAGGTFEDTVASTPFAGAAVDDLLTVFSVGGSFLGNFYITAVNSDSEIEVTPDFTGTVPSTADLVWTLVSAADLTAQRISAQDMALNRQGSLFFVDIAAESYDLNTTGAAPVVPAVAGADDARFNISDNSVGSVLGDVSLGHSFKQNTTPASSRDETLAFSVRERLIMSFTQRFMQTTVSDPIQINGIPFVHPTVLITDPNNNATELESRNIRVNFDKAPVIRTIQEFVDSGEGRVITENILIKHMFPAFLDVSVSYVGGLSEALMRPLIETLIDETPSQEALSASDIDFLMRREGEANDVTVPFELVSIAHNLDRTISVSRSEDSLLVSRLSHFFPGQIDLSR